MIEFASRTLTATLFIAPVLLASIGCGSQRPPASATTGGKLVVFVSILPQAYFVKRIGGERVHVEVLIGRGQSEHSYEPTPRQMLALSDAKLFFTIGVSAEKRFAEQAAKMQKGPKVVSTQTGITLRRMSAGEACNDPAHKHEEHDHDHSTGDDPHIWLDPLLVKTQAATIRDALSATDPTNAEIYAANCRAFETELDALHSRIASLLETFKGREVYVFHPSFGYFCDRFGLVQVAVEQDGKDPGPRQLDELQKRARAAGARAVFYQPQFSSQPAEIIARAIGGTAVAIDPLAEDYMTNLASLAAKVASALLPDPAPTSSRVPRD